MENLFPAFRFQTPSNVDVTPWEPSRGVIRNRRRQSGGDGVKPLVKPVELLRSSSPFHPLNNQVVEGPYDPSCNPSPLSLSGKHNVDSPTHLAVTKRNRRLVQQATMPPKPIADVNSVGVIFNNQSTEDLQVFCTKLSARRILDFRVPPGASSEKHLVGSQSRAKMAHTFQGIYLVYFEFEPRMLQSKYRFPIQATRQGSGTEAITMALASNCVGDDDYELYKLDEVGKATSVQALPRGEPLVVSTEPNSPYIVRCVGSQRGLAISMDASVIAAKARFSVVVDDMMPSISFMAQAFDSTTPNNAHRSADQTILVSFLPSRHH
ncbi:hypothetical protein ACHHYP_20137 [Achlya hypogyna]|uniref:Uncharacterized protein n=1 Tax=Achlya hypogyna TaxID=1202772 RepID=A0A1V9Z369_ACHHY|nr:hypothetical protein ACHHYP_20137 [Achlya hypogyna]